MAGAAEDAAKTAAPAAPPARVPDFTTAPDGARIRKLITPIAAGGGTIDIIRLRQPRYRDIMDFGDPATFILVEGGGLPHEDLGIIRQYVEALCEDVSGQRLNPDLLHQIDYRDAMALKAAVLSFFK